MYRKPSKTQRAVPWDRVPRAEGMGETHPVYSSHYGEFLQLSQVLG